MTGYTAVDLFCGAGGSGVGAHAAGIELVMAANHSAVAIDTHQANFPDTDHDCADISQVDPRRYPRTTFLWGSPECTNHTGANGKPRTLQQDLFTEPDPVAERSRATMWDIPRFAEYHRYPYVIVENVVQAADWEMWPAWLLAMKCLGYRYRILSLNSMHFPGENAPRAPQSRDRIYVVFTLQGTPTPDLDLRPAAHCATCNDHVNAVQWWKPNRKRARDIGKYRQQYLYRCPTCHEVVEPDALPAAAAIDWTIPGQRIGDRNRPLKDSTRARIERGIQRYFVPQLVPAGGGWNTTTSPVDEPMRARTTRDQTALCVPYYRTGVATPTDRPLGTVTTHDRVGLAFIAELRGGGSTERHVTEPLCTVTASGTHHMLVQGDQGPVPVGLTATRPGTVVDVDDCAFRMLRIPEISNAMAFPRGYILTGSKRDRVMQLGNAVTSCASEWLYNRCTAALERTTP